MKGVHHIHWRFGCDVVDRFHPKTSFQKANFLPTQTPLLPE
jgi:hypothetical protein